MIQDDRALTKLTQRELPDHEWMNNDGADIEKVSEGTVPATQMVNPDRCID